MRGPMQYLKAERDMQPNAMLQMHRRSERWAEGGGQAEG